MGVGEFARKPSSLDGVVALTVRHVLEGHLLHRRVHTGWLMAPRNAELPDRQLQQVATGISAESYSICCKFLHVPAFGTVGCESPADKPKQHRGAAGNSCGFSNGCKVIWSTLASQFTA